MTLLSGHLRTPPHPAAPSHVRAVPAEPLQVGSAAAAARRDLLLLRLLPPPAAAAGVLPRGPLRPSQSAAAAAADARPLPPLHRHPRPRRRPHHVRLLPRHPRLVHQGSSCALKIQFQSISQKLPGKGSKDSAEKGKR